MKSRFKDLKAQLEGELYEDALWRSIYATDASVYRQVPAAVITPKHKADLLKVIHFARDNELSIIPRTGGTSQSGQVVGSGMVVDVSKHMNKILEINAKERWVRVEPGVIRDQLNHHLKPYGLFFSPITSTANRAMIGGMVGNNSCGSNSIVYGTTRDHVLALETILSDGAECSFAALDVDAFHTKCTAETLEGRIYRQLFDLLQDEANRKTIEREFPKPSIHRRNTGYAIDLLLRQEPFRPGGMPLNLCTMLCGSEGTLAFTTEIKLHLDPLPLPAEVVICIHFSSVIEALKGAQIAMQLQPGKCELMDKIILDCTRANAEAAKNRFFIEGDPGAILMVEFRGNTSAEAESKANACIDSVRSAGYGYAYPKVYAPQTKQVWALRKAGLGVLGNLPGDPKSVSCIEDTAVALEDLPDYIEAFEQLMDQHEQQVVYYAHAGAGELHLRPILNMKTVAGQQAFYDISEATARLVKSFGGSLSGEHGDGRVRAEFIPLMIGEQNYELLRQIKTTWDPHHIFNPGKIVDAPPMKGDFRYEAGQETPAFDTVLDFSEAGGFIRMIEKCNGVGACRKLPEAGGTMCPSYMATRDEKDTTRARANALREFIGSSRDHNPFDSPEIFNILKYCLSCKGCSNECPSSVDMSALKAEFLHQYYQSHRRPLRDLVFGHFGRLGKLAVQVAPLSNAIAGNISKRMLGIAPQRTIPRFSNFSLRSWHAKQYHQLTRKALKKGALYFFCDEFTNYQDVQTGIKAVRLLYTLGYDVQLADHADSGRSQLSKGLLHSARQLARQNITSLSGLITADRPLVGIEPSALLTFRDEYLRLTDDKAKATALRSHVFLLEEFLYREAQKGTITSADFTKEHAHILLHGHCHQKALASIESTAFLLGLPENYTVEIIPSGCCGMAGSFGYEKDNFDLSMKIGELVLFPAVRNARGDMIIAASGTSCRHQIFDGTGKTALHPAEILWSALRGLPTPSPDTNP